MKTRRKSLTALQKSAKGRDCTVNLPECNNDPEKTVLAHLNTAFSTGGKELDFLAAFSCSACHAAIDGPVSTKHSPDYLELRHSYAVFKTQKIWLKEGLVTYKDQPDMSKVVFYGLD